MSKRTTAVVKHFWNDDKKPVPGRLERLNISSETIDIPATSANITNGHSPIQSPIKMPLTPKKQSKSGGSMNSSFQRYQEDTHDAWDDGDDDLLVRLKLDSQIIHSAANQVIESHNANEHVASSMNNNHTTFSADSGDARPQRRRAAPAPKRTMSAAQSRREEAKTARFEALIHGPTNNLLDELRKLSWAGVPTTCRPITWKILCGYLPASTERRKMTLDRKRQDYFSFLERYFGTRHDEHYSEIFRQIHIDVPRMNPLIPLFQNTRVQESFERILYIWATRHPASGYVQGINDLVTPFFVVFLTEFLQGDVESEDIDIGQLSKGDLDKIEADSFWCMSKLLEGIQDNYTFAQPGIQTKVAALKELTLRIDANLHNHIERQGIEFLQFSFRWMNNLLMRELPLRCTIRLWDTYLAEPDGFANYHLYVCAAFLTKFSKELMVETDFQGLMTKLQNLPTHDWQDSDIGELCAEAYRLKYMFADAPQHYKTKT